MKLVALILAGSLAGCAPAVLLAGGVAVTGGAIAFGVHEQHAVVAASGGASSGPENVSAFSTPTSTPLPTTTPPTDMSPKVVIPATGGPPVVGIPVGGNIYVPASGGPPITGIPTH